MGRYNVIITPDAAADLSKIKSYIAYTLQAPDTALKYIRGLRQEICKLDSFPAAIATVSDEPWQTSRVKQSVTVSTERLAGRHARKSGRLTNTFHSHQNDGVNRQGMAILRLLQGL